MARRLPKGVDEIQIAIAGRGDQLLRIAATMKGARRSKLRRLALELEKVRCNLVEVCTDQAIGELWEKRRPVMLRCAGLECTGRAAP